MEVETPTASPFASSLLFDYVATYMYEGDTPNAERRAAALSLDRDLLRELLGQDELRELIDPDALQTGRGRPPAPLRAHARRDARRARRRAAPPGRPHGREVAARVHEPASARGSGHRAGDERRASGCASAARSAGSRPTTPACTATRSAPCRPAGCPRRSWPTCPTPCAVIAARYARTHGPFTTDELRDALPRRHARGRWRRSSATATSSAASCARRQRRARVVRPRRPAAAAPRVAGVRCARRSSRPTSARSRVPAVVAGRRPPCRRPARPSTGCARCSSRSRAWRCPPSVGARRPAAPHRRVLADVARPAVRVGRGGLGRRGRPRAQLGKVALYFREDAEAIGRAPGRAAPRRRGEPVARRCCASGSAAAPCFFTDLLAEVALAPEEIQEALWDLVWAGEATNDALAPLRAPRLTLAPRATRDVERRGRGTRRFGARRGRRAADGAGTLVADVVDLPRGRPSRARSGARSPSCCSSATASSPASRSWPRASRAASRRCTTRSPLSRRSACAGAATSSRASAARSSRSPAPSSGCARAGTPRARRRSCSPRPTRPRRTAPRCRGRSGRRRAPAAVPRGRRVRRPRRRRAGGLRRARGPRPDAPGRPRRRPPAARAHGAGRVRRGRRRKLSLERIDGEPVVGSPVEEMLVELGFRSGPRKLTLSA